MHTYTCGLHTVWQQAQVNNGLRKIAQVYHSILVVKSLKRNTTLFKREDLDYCVTVQPVHDPESSSKLYWQHAVTMADAHGFTDADKRVSHLFVHSSPKLGMTILA